MATSPDQSAHFQGFYNRSPGITSVGSYQVSGTPFITGSTVSNNSEVQVDFPNVTKSITVINKDAVGNDAIQVHFASMASNGGNTITKKHFITLDAVNSSVTLNVKAKSIWISNMSGADSDFQLFAELTGIGSGAMWTLEGVGIDE
jgi:hypothetical protein